MPVVVVVAYMPVHLVLVEQVVVELQEILQEVEQIILVVVEVVVLTHQHLMVQPAALV
tara:strand:- start:38 stop:211 length:174 start_codon:yes stop_codon:yes gene_type:complete